jgi:tetratricopeptide (TPR) repeat protein
MQRSVLNLDANPNLALQGNDQEVIEIFDKALSINVEVLYNKGEVLDKLGETEEAQRYYDKALQLDPTYAGGFNTKHS